jgi:hypothetical protein
MPPEAVEHLFQMCSISEIKNEANKLTPHIPAADIDAILEKAYAQYNKCKEKLLIDTGKIWQKRHFPETLTQATLYYRGLKDGRNIFDKHGLLPVLFCSLASNEIPQEMKEVMKDMMEGLVKSFSCHCLISTIFFPFLVALQKPEMREFYRNINNKINSRLCNIALCDMCTHMRIGYMTNVSETLFTSDKLNENDKIMVMLFIATCSELELKVWETMQLGRSPSTIEICEIDYYLLGDIGMSPINQDSRAIMAAISVEQKNEKVQEATRRIENFFQSINSIGVEVNDL